MINKLEIINRVKNIQCALTELVFNHSSFDFEDFITISVYYEPAQKYRYSTLIAEHICVDLSSSWVVDHRFYNYIDFDIADNDLYFELSKIVDEFYADYHDYCKPTSEQLDEFYYGYE